MIGSVIGPAMRVVVLLLLAVSALAVVRTRDPAKQALGLGAYGAVLAILMVLYEAPDVALSQLVVGAIVEPILIVLALAKIRRRSGEARGD